jgi:hypothetical protein
LEVSDNTELLLEYDAHPSCTGNPSGTLWQARHILARFNDLNGASLLFICRNFNCILLCGAHRGNVAEKGEQEKIEQLLIDYGAEEVYDDDDET